MRKDLRKDERYLSRHHSHEDDVMVWGAISYYSPSELKVVDYKMTRNSYKAPLESSFPEFHDTFAPTNWIFQQDNAPIYTSSVIKTWIASQNVETLAWSQHSPDLNIIENLLCLRTYPRKRLLMNLSTRQTFCSISAEHVLWRLFLLILVFWNDNEDRNVSYSIQWKFVTTLYLTLFWSEK